VVIEHILLSLQNLRLPTVEWIELVWLANIHLVQWREFDLNHPVRFCRGARTMVEMDVAKFVLAVCGSET
jgi:hypothetical protein